MLSVERRHEISEWIYRNGKADISELARMFNVSCETIRRDLNPRRKPPPSLPGRNNRRKRGCAYEYRV